MPDITTIEYIFKNYSHLMTVREAAAMKHFMTTSKFHEKISNDTDNAHQNFLVEKGWRVNYKEVAELLKDGFDQFRIKTSERILKDNPNKIYFNHCSRCGKLARTPHARQCRFCGYDWHKQVVATFQIGSFFQLTNRPFFIYGDLLSGEIRIGMRADLTVLGLAIKPVIKAIEFARHSDDGIEWEDMCLGFDELSEEDKNHLKSERMYLKTIFIEDENAR